MDSLVAGLFSDIYRGKKILVTGHTGFKGSWLSLWLQILGAEVSGYSLGVPTSPSNFEILRLKNTIRHFEGDIRDVKKLDTVIDLVKPDVVFHLAAQALVRRSYLDPRETFETNIMGMVNILECIRSRPDIKAAVMITSDKVYRNDEWCWGYREVDVLGGEDPYSSSKGSADLVAQSYIRSFFETSATKIAIARAGNVIGGGDWASDRIVPDAIRAWVQEQEVEIRNPHATRPWQHVLEPLSGYLCLGEGLLKNQKKLIGEAYNFGPNSSVTQTVEDLLVAMSNEWGSNELSKVKINVNEGGRHEATLLKLSCDKALADIRWQPVLDFPDTVNMTVDWYRSWHSGRKNMLDLSVGQIERYAQLANRRGAVWTHN